MNLPVILNATDDRDQHSCAPCQLLTKTPADLPMKILLSIVSLLLLAPYASAQSSQDGPLAYSYPKIETLGKVVQLPTAAQQPRSGSKIVVDLIKGGDPTKLNSGIEKVARFVNIYAGAGAEPAEVEIAVVLHGEATLICLKPDAYAKRFKCNENPNAQCIKKLRQAGVKIYVCGQSLIGKGQHPDDVEANVKVAVSALTSLVNLQAEGHAYVPLGK